MAWFIAIAEVLRRSFNFVLLLNLHFDLVKLELSYIDEVGRIMYECRMSLLALPSELRRFFEAQCFFVGFRLILKLVNSRGKILCRIRKYAMCFTSN